MALTGRVAVCRFDGGRLPRAPQVLAVDTRLPGAGTPMQERDHARAVARAALREAIAPQLGCAPDALAISDMRGQPPRLARVDGCGPPAPDGMGLSISHAPGLSLAAWCRHGAVGVDVQAVPRAAGRAELWRTAALFFSPNQLQTLDRQALAAPFFEVFARAWAAHEAALKCAGLALAEYTPALAARLAGVRVAALALPGRAAPGLVAAVAWRPVTTP